MKITKVQAREIFDSRGIPTIECEIFLEDGTSFTASVPSGTSKGPYEAFELRDSGNRFKGLGVQKAIEVIETKIAPLVINREPEVISLDQLILKADGTANKENFGANSILAVSAAVVKAQAYITEIDLFGLFARLCEATTAMLPVPHINIINGGRHAQSEGIQEFMLVPCIAKNFKEAMEQSVEFFYALQDQFALRDLPLIYGQEGGLAVRDVSSREILDLIMETLKNSNREAEFKIALDSAASEFYDHKTKKYTLDGKKYSAEQLHAWYLELLEFYPICSLEDPFVYDDIASWVSFTLAVGDKVQIIGDDIFATDPQRIYEGITQKIATCAVIKPNQIGTITETLQAIQVCKEYGCNALVSHRSGETDDSLIADLAVGTSIGQIKAGGPTRGERLAKYNRLLAIEDQLALALLED